MRRLREEDNTPTKRRGKAPTRAEPPKCYSFICVAHSRYTGSLIGDEIIDGLLFYLAEKIVSCNYTVKDFSQLSFQTICHRIGGTRETDVQR